MNIKNLNLKDFKRNIAIILLAGLLLSLFGSFTYLIGMETAVIKDVNGAEFILTESQKAALARCKALEPFLFESERPEGLEKALVDLGGVNGSFVTQANIKQLAMLIAEPEKIKEIRNNKITLELFQLADRVMAPKKIVHALARDARIVVDERTAQLKALDSLTKEQAAELHNLQTTKKAIENGVFDIHKLLQKMEKKNIPLSTVLSYDLYSDKTYVDLSYENTSVVSKAKLESMNGIEKLVCVNDGRHKKYERAVHSLRLDNQNLEEVDLTTLKKRFPELKLLSLKNNRIKKISETGKIRQLEVDLQGNPLTSIAMQNPERCNYVTFKADNNPQLKVDFTQNNYSKMHTWLKAFYAKSCVLKSPYILPTVRMGVCAGLFVGGTLAYSWVNRHLIVLDADRALDKLILANGQELLLSGSEEVLNNFKEKTLAQLVHTYGPQACVTTLRKITPAIPEVSIDFFNKSSAMLGLKIYGFIQLIMSGVILSIDGLTSKLYRDRSMLGVQDMKEIIKKNPYRIKVIAKDNALIKEFPSNYTYNLFGKI